MALTAEAKLQPISVKQKLHHVGEVQGVDMAARLIAEQRGLLEREDHAGRSKNTRAAQRVLNMAGQSGEAESGLDKRLSQSTRW